MIRENFESEISQDDIDKLCNSMYNLNMNPGEEILDVIPQEFSIDGEHGILTPKGMIERFDLLNSAIYRRIPRTLFMDDYPWEKTDMVAALRKEAKQK